MRCFALAAALILAATPAFASDKDDVLKTVNAFVSAIDKNDMKGAAAAQVANPAIIDEFAPHHWSGPGSFAAWGADFGKDAAVNGVTEPLLISKGIRRVSVKGDHAYVVAPTDFSFKKKNKRMVEHGMIVYALDRTADGWKIASWAYSW